jgi:hypothetical protein
MEHLTRRKLIGGIGLLIAAPAVIRVAKLMPVKAFDEGQTVTFYATDYGSQFGDYTATVIFRHNFVDGKIVVEQIDLAEFYA